MAISFLSVGLDLCLSIFFVKVCFGCCTTSLLTHHATYCLTVFASLSYIWILVVEPCRTCAMDIFITIGGLLLADCIYTSQTLDLYLFLRTKFATPWVGSPCGGGLDLWRHFCFWCFVKRYQFFSFPNIKMLSRMVLRRFSSEPAFKLPDPWPPAHITDKLVAIKFGKKDKQHDDKNNDDKNQADKQVDKACKKMNSNQD